MSLLPTGSRDIVAVCLCAICFLSCHSTNDVKNEFGTDAFVIKGTMTYLAIEGGCWQFKSDDGTTYQVFGEQAQLLQHDGAKAEIIVRKLSNKRTICMSGTIVELLKIISTN